MIPWRQLDRADIPGEDHPLLLMQHGTEFAIRLGTSTLMGSLDHGSEELLAEQACARIANRADPRVLVGGLGMGFTLAAALRTLGPEARVEVAELIPAVVAWNRGALAHLAGEPLADRRVVLHEEDVAETIRTGHEIWDAILLDVDNGPDGLTRTDNDRLYAAAGLQSAREALRPGGVFGVWSVAPDPEFTRRLRGAGFLVDEVTVRARRARGGHHMLWLATRPQ